MCTDQDPRIIWMVHSKGAGGRKQQRICTVQQRQQGEQGLGKVLNEPDPLAVVDPTTKEPLVGRMQV